MKRCHSSKRVPNIKKEAMEEWLQDLLAMVGTMICALTWLKLMEFLSDSQILPSHTSRKLIHIGTGPIYLLCWNWFSGSPFARYWAAMVPLAITIKFGLIGLGILPDEKTVRSMSRTGRASELLKGPLLYGVIFVLATCIWWGTAPTGISALMLLCAGDGFADIIGRRYGKHRWPHNPAKSLEGSLAFFVSSMILQGLFVHLFHSLHWFDVSLGAYFNAMAIVSAVSCLVESLPLSEWDNLTVFLAAIVTNRSLGF